MRETEFDKVAAQYEAQLRQGIAISGEGPEYFAEYKIVDVARDTAPLRPAHSTGSARAQILDFGSGIGNSVPFVNQHLQPADLVCVDPSRKSLDVAQQRFPGAAQYVHLQGDSLPFEDNRFDIAFAMCVFHHIEADSHVRILQDLRRVIKPGGHLFVFEHNPWNPLTVKVVETCPFDESAVLIHAPVLRDRVARAGFDSPAIRFRVFFPRALSALRPLERWMTRLPLGGQYYCHAIK